MKKLPWILLLVSALLFIGSILILIYVKINVFPKIINKIQYACSNGKSMDVVYLEDMVRITFNGKKYKLYQLPIASGVRYANKEGYELFSKGNRVVFNVGEGAECFLKNRN